MSAPRRTALLLIVAAGLASALTGQAQAADPPTCPNIPVNERITEAPIVFVGKIVSERPGPGALVVYRFRVLQAVKGDLGSEIELRGPVLLDGRGEPLPEDVDLGVVAGLSAATPTVDSCGITNPAFLLANVDEPRGNGIRLVIGVLVFVGVLTVALTRLRKRRPGTLQP